MCAGAFDGPLIHPNLGIKPPACKTHRIREPSVVDLTARWLRRAELAQKYGVANSTRDIGSHDMETHMRGSAAPNLGYKSG